MRGFILLLMKSIYFLIVFLCSAFLALAQNDKYDNAPSTHYKPNVVYGELLGNGALYSINYERMLRQKKGELANKQFSIRIGFSYISHSYVEYNYIPLEFIWFKGEGKHHFEYGIGLTTQLGQNYLGYRRYRFFVTPRIGYRYQNPNGHLVLRIGLTGVIFFHYALINDILDIFPWPGISCGYAF